LSGTVLWDYADNIDFHNRMTGIGRDDETTFDQRQSRNYEPTSVVTVGHGSVAVNNASNSNSFSANQSYVLIGDDNDDLTGVNETDQGTTTNNDVIERRIARTWLLSESGTVGTLRLIFDLRTFPGVIQAAQTYDYSVLRLLVDADGVFASGAYSVSPTSYNYSSTDTSITFDYDFPTGISYFSLGTLDEAGSPLPVEFSHFSAEPVNNMVECAWGTATETNNDFFEVQRSANGVNWEVIETVKGAGTSITSKEYVVYDYQPLLGRSYYRIKQTDYDGKYDYSSIREVNINSEYGSNLEIISSYPNPFTHYISVEVSAPESNNYVWEIINNAGIIVKTENIDLIAGRQVLRIEDLAALTKGNYILRIRESDRSSSIRLLKQ